MYVRVHWEGILNLHLEIILHKTMQMRSKSCVVDTFESYVGIKLQK